MADIGNLVEELSKLTVIEAVFKARPNSVKGTYVHTCTLSATMSPPVHLDVREFSSH